MSEEIVNRPHMVINFRRNRIAITRKTLKVIGEPEYILLLVNPEERTLAVLRSDATERRAHRIRKMTGRKCSEICSKGLLKSLLNICDKWQADFSYTIYGDVVQGDGVIKFHIDNALLTSEKEQTDYAERSI